MVVGYVETRYIDLRLVCRHFELYGPGINSFSSTSVKFNQMGLADYNIFDVEQLADELMPLFDERILEVAFYGDMDHMKENVMWTLVNDCCVSVLDVVDA